MGSQTDNTDWVSWIPIVVLFCVGLWPVAVFLLLRKLLGMDTKKRRASHPYDIQREQQANQKQSAGPQAQTAQRQAQFSQQQNQYAQRQSRQQSRYERQQARQESAARKSAAKKARVSSGQPKLPRGRALTFFGTILTGIFGIGFLSMLTDVLAWGGPPALLSELSGLVGVFGFLALGVVMLGSGISRTRKGRRFHKYLALIGRRESVPIDSMAKTAGVSRRRLLDDLQDMLDRGLLPMGYLDMERDLLILSDEGIPVDTPAEPAPEPEPEKPQDDYAVLLEIRQVNDAIPDPIMSGKIDRIGEITGKILDYQRQNPGRDSQLRSFLNYYLPTTLKILRAYAQLDAQGVEGENISAAKARIEGMMDKVVEGFEHQLDELFRDRAMDISADVAVLEKMLEKDGLSGQNQGMMI